MSRTTLDLDPRVVAAGRARARANGTTIGAEISALALAGLAGEASSVPAAHGLVLLPRAPGHVLTDEMVADALVED